MLLVVEQGDHEAGVLAEQAAHHQHSPLPVHLNLGRQYYEGHVTDNQATLHEFVLLLERKTKGCQDEAEDVAASYPSLLAITARHGLINPMDRLIFNGAFSRSVGL